MSEEHAHAGVGGQRIRRPFPGSRPFGQSDARLFFGRSAQTRQLRSQWLTGRTVVLAGPPAIGFLADQVGVLHALSAAGVLIALAFFLSPAAAPITPGLD